MSIEKPESRAAAGSLELNNDTRAELYSDMAGMREIFTASAASSALSEFGNLEIYSDSGNDRGCEREGDSAGSNLPRRDPKEVLPRLGQDIRDHYRERKGPPKRDPQEILTPRFIEDIREANKRRP